MDIDFAMYAQLSGIPYMPTPEEYYPELSRGMQHQEPEQRHGDYRLPPMDVEMSYNHQNYQAHQNRQAPPLSMQHLYIDKYCQKQPQPTDNMSDGIRPNPYNHVCYQSTSPSEYRCMARGQRRAKEMMSRNGLYSPMDASGNQNSGGDSCYFPNYCNDYNGRTQHPRRYSHW
ncbi:hypothetical protein KR074_010732 [Drosophila pseudoananassae]|nr:hypothetical protein KR074_010732 [Drosophila pseudoananassae]